MREKGSGIKAGLVQEKIICADTLGRQQFDGTWQ